MKTSGLLFSIFYLFTIIVATAGSADDSLREAVTSGNVSMAETALMSGADIELNQEGNTPLMLALAKGNGSMAEMLIKHGAKPNGITPLFIATMKGDTEALKTLVKSKKDLQALDEWSENALHYAVRSKNLKVVLLLLQSGIKVNQKNQLGLTPLMVAVEDGSQMLINTLIDHKADINAQDAYGQTAIFIATARGNLEAVATLISRRANVNVLDKEENSALSIALANHEGYATRDDQESKVKAITYASIVKSLRKAGAIESGELSVANSP
ncbi:MAG: ankyrin repeat domain-containing protein [Candidatus Methylacidiphilales bacterium]|nr:ankyrin repeat domain-containing protein [Candidatus Methylacidiphilales bacterium]